MAKLLEKGIVQVENAQALWACLDKNTLYVLYDECFGNGFFDPTWSGEKYTIEEVAEIFEDYAENGMLVLCQCQNTNEIIGFCAALPLSRKTDIIAVIQEHLEDAFLYWYYADIGVRPQHRNQGIANKLACNLLKILPTGRVILRVRTDNNASIALHKKLGFTALVNKYGHEVRQQVPQLRKTGEIKTDEKIYFINK
ncbi:MAG: GNAT family N-acetyltransferase [Marinilabiliaceae bacterium]|nr:GNAT family N-acetyltransferase [Marinilabiliaceae bacterium]